MYPKSRLLTHHIAGNFPSYQLCNTSCKSSGAMDNTQVKFSLWRQTQSFQNRPPENLLMWFPQQFPCRHTLSPLSASEYDAVGKTQFQVGLSWQVVGSDLSEQAMSLKNSPCERDQARQLEVSRAPDNEKRTVPIHQWGTARSGQQIWFSIPLECSSEGRTLLSLLKEDQQFLGQSQCTLQLLLLHCKPSGLACRFEPTPPSQDRHHQTF